MFTLNELLKETNGKLITGKTQARISGVSIDSRTISSGDAFVAIKGNNFDGHDFIEEAAMKGASSIVIDSNKYAPLKNKKAAPFIKVRDTVRALGDLAAALRKKCDIPVIVVTGSNGKTTTKEMIAAALEDKFKVLKNEGTKNNHIGLPLTLLKLNDSHECAVLEAGTSRPGEIGYLARIAGPNIAVITNIGPSHLENFSDLNSVFREKYTLIQHLRKPYIVSLNADDRLLRKEVIKKRDMPVIFGFGMNNKTDFLATQVKMLKEKIKFVVNGKYTLRLNTAGLYNIYNALAAVSIARIFAVEYRDIYAALSNFTFPQGRLRVLTLNKVKFIDDTYNSNPCSLKQALETLGKLKISGRKIFVMGDMMELGKSSGFFHRQAGYSAAKTCDAFITVGKFSRLAARAARLSGFDSRSIFVCDSSQEAREALFNKISPTSNDVVLVKGSRIMRMEEVFRKSK